MKMILRWFGEGHDSVSLDQILQIPGVSGIAGTLMDKYPGECWEMDEVESLVHAVKSHGLEMEVIESVNIHDDIKLGVPSRDIHIENYKKTIKHLGLNGVRVICYNFMPIFDWMRTDLQKELPDGSRTMYYEHQILERMKDPNDIIKMVEGGAEGFSLPGWEPERLSAVKELFRRYEGITQEQLHENLKYFLEQIIPVCEQYDVKMAIHPDDPPWNLFGLPRVYADEKTAGKILDLVHSPYNGLTLCTGSLGVQNTNNVPEIIQKYGKRIHFGHIRNFKKTGEKDFYECSHLSSDGSLDMFGIIKAFHTYAPDCYIRPDHGRCIWNESCRPGYGLYDRALGAAYINGIWEALDKTDK